MNIILALLATALTFTVSQYILGVWIISVILAIIVGILVYNGTATRRI